MSLQWNSKSLSLLTPSRWQVTPKAWQGLVCCISSLFNQQKWVALCLKLKQPQPRFHDDSHASFQEQRDGVKMIEHVGCMLPYAARAAKSSTSLKVCAPPFLGNLQEKRPCLSNSSSTFAWTRCSPSWRSKISLPEQSNQSQGHLSGALIISKCSAWYSLDVARTNHCAWPRINDLLLAIVHLHQQFACVQLLQHSGCTVLVGITGHTAIRLWIPLNDTDTRAKCSPELWRAKTTPGEALAHC